MTFPFCRAVKDIPLPYQLDREATAMAEDLTAANGNPEEIMNHLEVLKDGLKNEISNDKFYDRRDFDATLRTEGKNSRFFGFAGFSMPADEEVEMEIFPAALNGAEPGAAPRKPSPHVSAYEGHDFD